MIAVAQPKQSTAIQTTTHFDPQKATTQLINSIPAALRDKANNYAEGGHWLLLWNVLCAAVTAWLFLFGGLSAYLQKRFATRKNQNWRNFLYIVSYFILAFLLSLPLDIYQNFIREQQYGFSNQNFVGWLLNDLITFLIELK